MSEIADCLLDGIFSKFDIDEKSSGRYYSYLQACLYYKAGENNGRAYSQEPHEDGHFLTFITANSKGLCLHNGKLMEQVNFADGEFIVMAGSALSILSDHAIKSIYHSVDSQLELDRTSVVYFLNPDRSEEHTSELQSPCNLVCRLLLEKKTKNIIATPPPPKCSLHPPLTGYGTNPHAARRAHATHPYRPTGALCPLYHPPHTTQH